MPILTFIIPTRGRDAILFQSLERLMEAVEGLDVEVLVINDDKGRSIPMPEKLNKIQVLENAGRGVASARNFGAGKAKSPLLWFLDDDIWISKEVLMQGLMLHQAYPDSIFNFNWVYPESLLNHIRNFPFGRFLEAISFTSMKGWCKGMEWEDQSLMKTKWLAGATLLIPTDLYAKVGGYDASFPLAGFEDYDFSVRVQKSEVDCYIEARVMTFHNEENKTSLRGFLQRTYQNAITRRHAVRIGYHDQALTYSGVKKGVYQLLIRIEPMLLTVADRWPGSHLLDWVYFRLCHALIGLNMYKGYISEEERKG